MSPINYGALGALDPRCRFIVGDCRASLASLEAESVQACVTSPPYFGLRDYGTGVWDGGDPDCEHIKGELRRGVNLAKSAYSTRGGAIKAAEVGNVYYGRECERCGALRTDRQLGLEPTPGEFVAALVVVFREVRRVLRDDGTVWLNLGDSYSGSGPSGASYESETTKRRREQGTQDGAFRVSPTLRDRGLSYAEKKPTPAAGTKAKDLIGIPWMVAFALRADGWYLRSDIIWSKPNPMPESVRDRPTKAHEYIFLLAKSKRYFYDADAIKEAATHGERFHGSYSDPNSAFDHRTTVRNGRKDDENTTAGRNKRSVWTVAPKPFPGAHFATFPPKLIEPCILAGCPEGGTVLDPFAGAGTTGMVALRHSRSFVGCEINDEYVRLAQDRIIADQAPAKKKRARKTPVAA